MSSAVTSTTASPTDQLVQQLYRLGAIQRQVFRTALADLGGPQGIPALGVLHRDGPQRVSELAARLAVDLSVASRQVSALEAAGHLRREPDPTDRRATLVAVTPSGVELLREAHGRMVAAFADVVGDWPPEEVAALAAGLTRLREDFEGETDR